MFNDISKLIDQSEIVSFDIFDTLLFRNISRPTDIFRIMDNIIKEKYNIEDFYNLRINAELEARKECELGEANLNQIYDQLLMKIKNKKTNDAIKKLEKELELEFIVANPFMKKVYDYCVANNKLVLLISDMYLSKNFIMKLLKKSGYKIKENNIYVSCECKANKGTKTLFEYVKNDRNLDYSKWCHIGDNVRSDYTAPIELGISAYNYKNINSYEENNSESIFESIMLGMRNNKVYNGSEYNYWENFGYKYVFPIYLGFTNWLYKMTEKCDNLFFIARDGYIIQKIYKLLSKDDNKYIDYLYCSRNSIQIPTMFFESKDNLLKLLTINIENKKTLGDLFVRCGLDKKDEYMSVINLYGFCGYDDMINADNKYNAIKCICAFIDDITEKMKESRELSIQYLKQQKVDSFDTVNVMDIGWGGSIQESIATLLNKKIKGYYFGTINLNKKDYISNSFGYMFDQGIFEEERKRIFDQVMMYELIFSAPHGSTKSYKKEKKSIIPVLGEADKTTDVVNLFQNSSIEMIKNVLNYYKYFDSINKDFCVSFFDKFLKERNYNDLVEFSKIGNDYELGDTKKHNYVTVITKEDLNKDCKYIRKKINQSLWKDAYLIEGIDSIEQHNKSIHELNLLFEKSRLNKYMDKFYDTRDDYLFVLNKYANKEYVDELTKYADEMYQKHCVSYKRRAFRNLVPLSLRIKLKKLKVKFYKK